MDHQQPFDDRGWVRVVDSAGNVTTLAGEFWGEEGLAWSADGTTVLFGANDRTNTEQKDAGDLSYQIRSVVVARPGVSAPSVTGPADFTIHDVARDGRLLVTRDDMRLGVGVRLRGDTADRDLSFLHQNWGVSLSDDGSKVLFSDGTAGANYGVVWRKPDRSPIVRLGEGTTLGLSSDGQVGAGADLHAAKTRCVPARCRRPRHAEARSARRTSHRILVSGRQERDGHGTEKGKPVRLYRQAFPDGLPVPLLPEGVTPALFSPITLDGQHVLAFDEKGGWQWHAISGGPPRAIPSLSRDEPVFVAGWASDGRSPLVQTTTDVPLKIDTLDFATGRRTPFKTIGTSDLAGLKNMGVRSLSSDGLQYAFGFSKALSTVFVVSQTK